FPHALPRAGNFLLLGQEKVTKEKATPRTRPPHIHVFRVRERSPRFADGTSVCLRRTGPSCGPSFGLFRRPLAASEGARLARILRAVSCNGTIVAWTNGHPCPAQAGRVTTRLPRVDMAGFASLLLLYVLLPVRITRSCTLLV